MIRRTLCLVSCLCLFTFVGGCQSAAPRTAMDILSRSKAALAEVQHVSYRAEFEGTGWLKARVPAVDGDVVMGPKSQWDIARFRCDVAIKTSDSDETLRFVSGSDGDIYFLIDATTEMAHEDMDSAVLGSHGRDIQRVLMDAFVSDQPFGEDLEPDSLELVGTQKINGEVCYEIRIKSESPPEVVWVLSKKDFLPRRITRIYPNRRDPEGESGTTQLTVRDVTVNPSFAVNPFVLQVPEGYTKTDDFAP